MATKKKQEETTSTIEKKTTAKKKPASSKTAAPKKAPKKTEEILAQRHGAAESNERLPEGLEVSVPHKAGFGANRFRPNFRGINANETLFIKGSDKYEDQRTPKEIALEKLKAAQDPHIQTVFTGKVEGIRILKTGKLDADGNPLPPKRAVLVNTTAGVPGHSGTLVNIFYDDLIVPNGSENSIKQQEENYIDCRSRGNTEYRFTITDFIETGDNSQFIIGSRHRVALKQIQKYWFGKKDGDYLIKEGSEIETQIVYVQDAGVTVEAFGTEFFIPKKELSYVTITDCRELFREGQKLKVKVKNIKRNMQEKRVYADLSYKDTIEDTRAEAMREYLVGDQIRYGSVKRVLFDQAKKELKLYISVKNKFDVLCVIRNSKLIPTDRDKVDFIIQGIELPPEYPTAKMWGEITKIYPGAIGDMD